MVIWVEEAARAGGASLAVATALFLMRPRWVRSTFTVSTNCRRPPFASVPTSQQTSPPESVPPPVVVTVTPEGSVSQTSTSCAAALPVLRSTSV